jgi:hypothetical protein
VTVCIAAICPAIKKLVFVSDSLLSWDHTSAEGARKMDLLCHDGPWIAMFAGPAGYFLSLTDRITKSLTAGPQTLDQMMSACEGAHAALRIKRVETEILAPYNITLGQFVESGLKWFGESRFNALASEIKFLSSDIGIELLVAGFDSDGIPRMFEVARNGVVTRIDQLNYNAIGSGSFIALTSLHPIGWFAYDRELGAILYRLLAAKFAAESASGVGDKHTTAVVVSRDYAGVDRFVPSSIIKKAHKIWEKAVQAPPPKNIVLTIKGWYAVDPRI